MLRKDNADSDRHRPRKEDLGVTSAGSQHADSESRALAIHSRKPAHRFRKARCRLTNQDTYSENKTRAKKARPRLTDTGSESMVDVAHN